MKSTCLTLAALLGLLAASHSGADDERPTSRRARLSREDRRAEILKKRLDTERLRRIEQLREAARKGAAVSVTGGDGSMFRLMRTEKTIDIVHVLGGDDLQPKVAVGKGGITVTAPGRGKDGASVAVVGSGPQSPTAIKQVQRMLKLRNASDDELEVFVLYRTRVGSGSWKWQPAAPDQSDWAIRLTLKPGQEVAVEHDGKKVAASQVRVWAVSGAKRWAQYRDTDLWLVPETNADGEHSYRAEEMGSYTLVFPSTGRE